MIRVLTIDIIPYQPYDPIRRSFTKTFFNQPPDTYFFTPYI